MNDPLPAPAFNLTVHVKSTDIDAGYAGGLEQAQANGRGFSVRGSLPPMPSTRHVSRNPLRLIDTRYRRMKLALKRNAVAIASHSALAGLRPHKFVNRFSITWLAGIAKQWLPNRSWAASRSRIKRQPNA